MRHAFLLLLACGPAESPCDRARDAFLAHAERCGIAQNAPHIDLWFRTNCGGVAHPAQAEACVLAFGTAACEDVATPLVCYGPGLVHPRWPVDSDPETP